jgi:PAS domain S-box-containing protein
LGEKPRILILHSTNLPTDDPLSRAQLNADLVHAESVPTALALLRREKFDGIYADTADLSLLQQAGTLIQADRILEILADGVVLVDPDLRILWANREFEHWCGGPVEGKKFYEALGSPEILGPDYSPFHTALQHGPIVTCLHAPNGRYLHFHVSPIRDQTGAVTHFIGLGRDITSERQQQQKLDAIHRAGREMAALSPAELSDMTPADRIELLKTNILRYTHELLHYNVVEVRLLDPISGRLEPLITEGITEVAAQRTLYAQPTGNGVTGFVAATGKSYLCPDTATDPLYLEGAAGAKSSLTVPLIYQDQVVGTFNVESPQPNAFSEQDQQFLEIFSREIADALHTLELLVAEKRSAASQFIEAISREVALPVDDILHSAAALSDRYIGHDPEMADHLRQILTNARAVKACIQKVGDTFAPPAASTAAGAPSEQSHPGLRGLRVLLVDSDDRVRRAGHNLLARFGCVVETARDGKEALVMTRLGHYEVILADIRLPDMTGYEFFHRLRKEQPAAQIVLMSSFGYDPSHSIVKARQEGLRGVLYKPFRIDQLIEVLENLPAPNSEVLVGATAQS